MLAKVSNSLEEDRIRKLLVSNPSSPLQQTASNTIQMSDKFRLPEHKVIYCSTDSVSRRFASLFYVVLLLITLLDMNQIGHDFHNQAHSALYSYRYITDSNHILVSLSFTSNRNLSFSIFPSLLSNKTASFPSLFCFKFTNDERS